MPGMEVDVQGGHHMPLRHESLVAWQRADDLFIKLHRLTLQSFPSYEKFELGSQLRRAAYSVPANIVEGLARRYRRTRVHFSQHLRILTRRGRLLHPCSKRLGYISDETCLELETDVRKVAAPLTGLVRAANGLPTALTVLGSSAGGALLMFLVLRFLP
jgi:four helix bundle protein